MDRTKKIIRLQELEEAIKQKEEQICEEKIELEKLKKEHARERISELPLLLFMLNHTCPMPEHEWDWEYEYIYYCPDLDDTKQIIRYRRNEFLPNAIDLREQFENLGMPNRVWPGRGYHEYYHVVMQAVAVLKSQIDDLFNSHDINSWADLGMILTNGALEKGYSKVLKNNTQK